MPVESAVPAIKVTRPEIYFGELTNTRRLRQHAAAGVQLPAGRHQQRDLLRGHGRHRARRLVPPARSSRSTAATSRRLPFSDDITAESRLLMRRNIRERVQALAPFLIFDPDPYIVIDDEGRLLVDARRVHDIRQLSVLRGTSGWIGPRMNYMRNSVKAVGGRLRRIGGVLRLRRRRTRSSPRIAAIFPDALQGCGRDAAPSCASTSVIRS